MNDRSKLVIVVLLLLSVATIFVSPAVDLQPTALRALQLANLFFAFLALGASAASALLEVPLSRVGSTIEREWFLAPSLSLLDLNCVRLC